MLEIKNLETYYGKLQILKRISLSAQEGKITCLLGGNGSGKTTALKSVVGLVPPARGSIKFMDRSINGLAPDRIVRLGISLIPQSREIFPKLTVIENLELGAFIRKNSEEIEEDFEKAFQLFPALEGCRKQLAGTLSGGQQQMLAVCRGLMSRPKLLLMDEPSAGFAPVIVEEVFDVVKRLNDDGMTILLVEHNVSAALSVGDFAYIMTNGEIVASDSCENLKDNPDLKSAYLGG
jgi:branched-chain amino acid transport system ATP-binding protein